MSHPATKKIEVLSSEVRIVAISSQDYICLTDIARYKGKATTDDLIRNWLRNRNTVEFLGLWKQINNPGFNPVEFDGIRMQAGLNSFTLTPKQWIERTGAIQTHLIPRAQQGEDPGSLCQRSRSARHGPVRPDGGPMAHRQPEQQGQHPRPGDRRPAGVPRQPENPQRPVHQPGAVPGRTTDALESDCHSANAAAQR